MEAVTVVALAVGVVVAAVWTTAMLHGIVSGDYRGAEYATPVMLFVAGYLFGVHVVRQAANGNGKR